MSTTPTTQPLKLNLGCGVYKVDGWVNIDSVPDFQPDLLMDISAPFALIEHYGKGNVDEIYAGHILEHLDNPDLALRDWFDLLRPGGYLTVTMPDHRKAVELWAAKERFPVLTDNPMAGLFAVSTGFYGHKDYQEKSKGNPALARYQMHKRSLDLPVLSALMSWAGFVDLCRIDESRCEAAPKFNVPVIWQMVLRGRKPEAIVHPV
jgi:predicted SAM-dependent methyltransferase